MNRADTTIHTNTVEGAFSIFKRRMRGVYQHCAEPHLHRYLGEFQFRYNNRIALGCNNGDRAAAMLQGVVGTPPTVPNWVLRHPDRTELEFTMLPFAGLVPLGYYAVRFVLGLL